MKMKANPSERGHQHLAGVMAVIEEYPQAIVSPQDHAVGQAVKWHLLMLLDYSVDVVFAASLIHRSWIDVML
ncbi:hypothetical protein [Xenorhabdus bovienii]|uniref:hypothetical protein n=1 Tax=Xenorhabdus bovienii TaxID=40576 RepID=UPI003DA2FE35